MRIACVDARASVVSDDKIWDVATVSDGRYSSQLDHLIGELDEFQQWFASARPEPSEICEGGVASERLGQLFHRPAQIFAIGLNYRQHASEMGLPPPDQPMVFTKFSSSLCGPFDPVPIVSPTTDYEAELVAVIGQRARHVSIDNASRVVAGYCVGQDYSERTLQMSGAPAQFSLGKSFQNFTPLGPWLTTRDEIINVQQLQIQCRINGECWQDSSTSDMVFDLNTIISFLSQVVELRPGDLIFTGSPVGVGQGRKPAYFLRPGDVVETSIEGLGSIRNVAVSEVPL